MDFPEGRGVYTQRYLFSSGENQASGISPPGHTSTLGLADRVAAGSTGHREKKSNITRLIRSIALAPPGSGSHSFIHRLLIGHALCAGHCVPGGEVGVEILRLAV